MRYVFEMRLKGQIDRDFERPERKIMSGEYMEAHEAQKLIMEELHRV